MRWRMQQQRHAWHGCIMAGNDGLCCLLSAVLLPLLPAIFAVFPLHFSVRFLDGPSLAFNATHIARRAQTFAQVAGWLNASTMPLFISYCGDDLPTSFVEYYDTAKAQGKQFRSALGLPSECSGPNDITCGPFFCHLNTTYIVLQVRHSFVHTHGVVWFILCPVVQFCV